MFRCERSDRIYSPQLPFAGPLAYKADNHKKIWKKGGQPESTPGNRAADCSGFCMPMKHD